MTTIDSTNPYQMRNNKPELQDSVLLLLDVLGYSEMANTAYKSGEQQRFLNEIHDALLWARSFLEDAHPDRSGSTFALKAFTDDVVVGFPVVSGNLTGRLAELLEKVAAFQFCMVARGFFVRGAVAIGKAYIDDVAVAGDALFEAYNAERNIACNPRIILTDSVKAHVVTDLRFAPTLESDLLLEDSDNRWFVNYLHETFAVNHLSEPFSYFVKNHKERVERRLEEYSENAKIFSKYAWVARYHDFFCDNHLSVSGANYKINKDVFGSGFRRIR